MKYLCYMLFAICMSLLSQMFGINTVENTGMYMLINFPAIIIFMVVINFIWRDK